METAFYDGKSRTFTFERFCELLVQAYNDVEETGEEVTEERKMRTSFRGLQDPRCESAKNTILVTLAIEEVWLTQWTWWQKFWEIRRVLQIQPKEVFLQYQMVGEEASEV